MKLSKLALDLSKDNDGVDIDFGDGFIMWIARNGNHQHVEAQERYMRPHRAKIDRGGRLPDELANKLLGCIVADGLIRKWTGLEDDDGKAIKYDAQKARDLMCDPRYEDLRRRVINISQEVSIYYEQDQEKDRETLKNLSAGN